MKGRETLFSAFKEVDLTAFLAGAKAAAEEREARIAAIFIMVGGRGLLPKLEQSDVCHVEAPVLPILSLNGSP